MTEEDLRDWLLDLCAGLVVLALGLLETARGPGLPANRFAGVPGSG